MNKKEKAANSGGLYRGREKMTLNALDMSIIPQTAARNNVHRELLQQALEKLNRARLAGDTDAWQRHYRVMIGLVCAKLKRGR